MIDNRLNTSSYIEASTHIELITLYEKSLGTIPAVEEMSYAHGLVGMDEISFVVRPEMSVGEQKVVNPYYDIITGDMLLKIRNIKSNEYQIFWIDESNLETLADGTLVKRIHAFSREYEFSRKVFQGVDLTSRILYYSSDMPEKYKEDSDGIPRGILNEILPKRGWSLKHIDKTLKYKARTVSVGEASEYELFMQLQEIFDCVFTFDTINKTVSIYDLELHTEHSGVVVSEKNIIDTFAENTNYHDIVTRLYIYGEDGLSIAMFSPTGMPYIENFGYYRSPEFMSQALLDALDVQDERIKKETLIQEYNKERVDILMNQLPEAHFRVAQIEDELRKMERHLDIIKTQESFVEQGWDDFLPTNQYDLEGNEEAWFNIKDSATLLAFMAAVKTDPGLAKVRFNGYEYASSMRLSTAVPQEIREKYEEDSNYERSQGGLAGWKNRIEKLEFELEQLKEKILERQKIIDIYNCFPESMSKEERLKELSRLETLVSESVYREESLSMEVMGELIEEGQKKLRRISAPKIQFTITAIDFSRITGMENMWDHMQLGDIVQIRTDTGFDYPVRLIKVEHVPDERSLTLTFSSGAALYDSAIFLADLLSTANSAAGLLQLGKGKWDDAAIKSPQIEEELRANFDLVKQQLQGAAKQKPVLDERGLWLYGIDDEGNPLPEQIRAINNVIAITQDDWETIEVALTPRGINANTITAGVMSASLVRAGVLQNADGSIMFDLENNTFNIRDIVTYSPDDGFKMTYVQDEVKHMNEELQEAMSEAAQGLRTELGEVQKWTELEFIKVDQTTTELRAKDGELASSVKNLKADLDNEVEGLKGSIRKTDSKITQTYDKIKLEVADQVTTVEGNLNTEVKRLESSITQTANDISLDIGERIRLLDGDYTDRFSTINQSLSNINLAIGDEKSGIIAGISINEKAIKGVRKDMNEGQIVLTGNTTTDGNFTLETHGDDEAVEVSGKVNYRNTISRGRMDLEVNKVLTARVMGYGFRFYPTSNYDDGGMIKASWGNDQAYVFYHGGNKAVAIGGRDGTSRITGYMTFDRAKRTQSIDDIYVIRPITFSSEAPVSISKLQMSGDLNGQKIYGTTISGSSIISSGKVKAVNGEFTGNTSVGGKLTASSHLEVSDTFVAKGDATMHKSLTVDGKIYAKGGLSVGSLNISSLTVSDLSVTSGMSLSGNLSTSKVSTNYITATTIEVSNLEPYQIDMTGSTGEIFKSKGFTINSSRSESSIGLKNGSRIKFTSDGVLIKRGSKSYVPL